MPRSAVKRLPRCFDCRSDASGRQKQAREFCRQTGIRRDYAREYVGTDGGKQAAAKVNASGMRALYSSYSGGSVTTAYAKERKEEAENLAALMPLARQGKAVKTMPR
ncbi:MAG: hypothetical protein IJ191_06420 [Treponema sp.]|nr:hypothetical protein [Treponema sp.]